MSDFSIDAVGEESTRLAIGARAWNGGSNRGLSRLVSVAIVMAAMVGGLVWYEVTNSSAAGAVNALVPSGHVSPWTFELKGARTSGVYDITMGAFTNYTNTDLKVLSVHPNISSANVRFLGTFLLSSCEPLSHAPAIYEPRNRWSSPTYLPKATTMAPTAVAVLPRSVVWNLRLPRHGWRVGSALHCPMQPHWIWESRVDILRSGTYLIRGFTVTYEQAGNVSTVQYPGPRFLFAFGVGHASSAKSR